MWELSVSSSCWYRINRYVTIFDTLFSFIRQDYSLILITLSIVLSFFFLYQILIFSIFKLQWETKYGTNKHLGKNKHTLCVDAEDRVKIWKFSLRGGITSFYQFLTQGLEALENTRLGKGLDPFRPLTKKS